MVARPFSGSIHKVSTTSIPSRERREARARPSRRTERGSSAPPPANRSPRGSRSCSPSERPVRPGVTSQRAEFLRLHNEVAMECMRRPQDLPAAFEHFVGANELHVRTHGFPSSEAVYNQACCLARGAASAAEAFATGATDPAAGLPPQHSDPEGLAENRLDLAVAALDAAITAGYHDDTNLLHDSDLEYLRERRPVQFAHILWRAQDPVCRGHCELVGEVPAPAGAVARCLPATSTSSRRHQLRATLPRRQRQDALKAAVQ